MHFTYKSCDPSAISPTVISHTTLDRDVAPAALGDITLIEHLCSAGRVGKSLEYCKL